MRLSSNDDYVRLARAYGVKERTILRKHAFRNAQLPVITIRVRLRRQIKRLHSIDEAIVVDRVGRECVQDALPRISYDGG